MNDKINIEIPEDEDVARAKAWWKENGSSIIGGVVIGTALVVGYNFWNQFKDTKAEQASVLYQQAVSPDNAVLAKEAVSELVADYGDSVYATLAMLQQAKSEVEADDLSSAAKTLESAVDLSREDVAMASIARLRLASVHNAAGNHDKALTVLNDNSLISAESLKARVEELKGDAFFGKDDIDAAKIAYQASLDSGTGGQSRALVQLKLDNL